MARQRRCCATPRGCGPHAEGCQQGAMKLIDPRAGEELEPAEYKPDWSRKCVVCGSRPVVPCILMCGPCTFGESATEGGNW